MAHFTTVKFISARTSSAKIISKSHSYRNPTSVEIIFATYSHCIFLDSYVRENVIKTEIWEDAVWVVRVKESTF